MGFLDSVNEVLEFIGNRLKRVWEWLSDPKTAEQAAAVFRLILIIIQGVGKLNEPVPKRDRPKSVRLILDWLQKLGPEEWDQIGVVIRSGGLDQLTSDQKDDLIGAAIGANVEVDKIRSGERKGPIGNLPRTGIGK